MILVHIDHMNNAEDDDARKRRRHRGSMKEEAEDAGYMTSVRRVHMNKEA